MHPSAETRRWTLTLLCLSALHAVIMLWQAGTENDSNSGNESEMARMGDRGLAVWKLSPHKPNNQGERGRPGGRQEVRKRRKTAETRCVQRCWEVVKQDLKWFLFSWAGRFRSGRSEQTWEAVKLLSGCFHQVMWQEWTDEATEKIKQGKSLNTNSTLNPTYMSVYRPTWYPRSGEKKHPMLCEKVQTVTSIEMVTVERTLTIISMQQQQELHVVSLP